MIYIVLAAIVGLVSYLVVAAFSWALTCLLVFLIALCFGLKFDLAVATGIWLVLWLLKKITRAIIRK